MQLNLGCGKDIRQGFINVDAVALPEVDVVHDLNAFPYPFEDESVDFVLMSAILEHLKEPIDVLAEVHRILRPHGICEIIVPYYKHYIAIQDPTHRHLFHPNTISFVCDHRARDNYRWYTNAVFHLLDTKVYNGTIYWHLKKRLGIEVYIPWFPSHIKWVIQKDVDYVEKHKNV